MPTLPCEVLNVIVRFAPMFSKRVWERAQVLLRGAMLSAGKRTMPSALRVMGLYEERPFPNDPRRAQSCGVVTSQGESALA